MSTPTSPLAGSVWVTCFVSIRFDLDIGPKVEYVTPPDALTGEGKQKVIQCAFPDCNPDCAHNFIFSFTVPDCTQAGQDIFSETVANPTEGNTLTPLFGAAYYRQKKDPCVPRGYVQQVILLLSRVPFVAVHELILRVVAPRFAQCCPLSADTDRVAVSSALAPFPSVYFPMDPSYNPAHYTQEQVLDEALAEVSQWPTPHPRVRYTVTLLHQALEFVTPSHSSRPPQRKLQNAVKRPPMKLDDRTVLLDETLLNVHGSGAVGGLGGVVSSAQDVLPLYGLLGDHLHYLTHLWELVICHEPLFILSNTPSMASASALAVASLITPIEYTGKLHSYFTVQNAEFGRLSRMGRAIPFDTDCGLIVAGTNPFFLRSFVGWRNLVVTVDRFTGIGAARAAFPSNSAACSGGGNSSTTRRTLPRRASSSAQMASTGSLHSLSQQYPETLSPVPDASGEGGENRACFPSGTGCDGIGAAASTVMAGPSLSPPSPIPVSRSGVLARLSSAVFTPGASFTTTTTTTAAAALPTTSLPYGSSFAGHGENALDQGEANTPSSVSPPQSFSPTFGLPHARTTVTVPLTNAADSNPLSASVPAPAEAKKFGEAAWSSSLHPRHMQSHLSSSSSSTHAFLPDTEYGSSSSFYSPSFPRNGRRMGAVNSQDAHPVSAAAAANFATTERRPVERDPTKDYDSSTTGGSNSATSDRAHRGSVAYEGVPVAHHGGADGSDSNTSSNHNNNNATTTAGTSASALRRSSNHYSGNEEVGPAEGERTYRLESSTSSSASDVGVPGLESGARSITSSIAAFAMTNTSATTGASAGIQGNGHSLRIHIGGVGTLTSSAVGSPTTATSPTGMFRFMQDEPVDGPSVETPTSAAMAAAAATTEGAGSPLFTPHDYNFLKASAKVAATKKIAKNNPVNSRTKLQHSLMNYFDSSFSFTLDHEEQTAFLMKRLEAVSRMDTEAQSASVSLHVSQYYDNGGGGGSESSSRPSSCVSPQRQHQHQHTDPSERWESPLPLGQGKESPYLDTIFAQYTIADDMVRKFFTSLTNEFLSPISAWFSTLVESISAFKLCDRAMMESMLSPASFLEFFYHKHREVAPRMWTRHHTYKSYKGVYERFANGCLFTAYVAQLVDRKLRREIAAFEASVWAAQFPSEPERIDMFINVFNVVQRELARSLDPDVVFVTTATSVLVGMTATISEPLRDQFMIKIEDLKL